MGVVVSSGMDESSGEPTLDEFLRQLQAEMDIADQIPDKEERNQRQWQIGGNAGSYHVQQSLETYHKTRT